MIYWYKNCPLCDEDGELAIVRRSDGNLYFRCEECFWTYSDASDVEYADRGFGTTDEIVSYPSIKEIEEGGWRQYCVHEMESS